MRRIVMLLALASLTACKQQPKKSEEPAKPAALTYEGGDYKDDAAKLAHGKRLADILDCTGCHGANLQGNNLSDEPKEGPLWAPNISLLIASYSDAELERLIRHGEPKDGREFWFMPVESYQFLSDADLAAIIAYLRSVKPGGEAKPAYSNNREIQKEVAEGLVGNAKAQIVKYRKDQPVDLGPHYAQGRYIVRTTCTGCHNNALQGWEHFTPNLDIAGTYSKAELTHLLETGEGKTKKNLGMMSGIARDSFSKLTPGEREAVVDYILARAHRPQQAQ